MNDAELAAALTAKTHERIAFHASQCGGNSCARGLYAWAMTRAELGAALDLIYGEKHEDHPLRSPGGTIAYWRSRKETERILCKMWGSQWEVRWSTVMDRMAVAA